MFKKLGLGIKLNLLLLLVLGILLFATILLLFFNTRELTREIGNERITEEVNIFQKRLEEIERELAVDVRFTVSSIPFIQAVGRRNAETVTELVTIANESLQMDDVYVVDGDGNLLSATRPGEIVSEDDLLATALKGTADTGVLVETNETGKVLHISSAAPITSLRQSTVLGAVRMGRTIDDDFLRELAFDRDGVYIGLVHENRIRARTTSDTNAPTFLYKDIAVDPSSAWTAANGQVVVAEELVSSGSVPFAVAYIPLLNTRGALPASLMILVELDQISAFQNSTLANTILVFAVLALIAILVIYLSLHRIAIRPLTSLKSIAQEMTGGHYDQRIPVSAQDEVGQLAEAFNEMAKAIQQREKNLQYARTRAERADQVKSAFLASMSHELRTPLNAVINFTQFIIDGDVGPVTEDQLDLLTDVVGSARHLLNLINDVLDMSKIEAGSLNLFVEDNVNLPAILNNVVSIGQGLLANKSVKITTAIDAALPHIRGDRQRILQIMLNLMSNACKFTQEGTIRINAHKSDNEIIIEVSDTGPGISLADQQRVFEAFKQTSSGIRQGGGTGLGMPIAKNLAEAHGGRLWLHSEVGKGSTFYVALPVKSSELVPTLA